MKYLRKAEELVGRCIHPRQDLEAIGLRDPESRWSYTVFLQALGKYLEHRSERDLVDEQYQHARGSLLHYAGWMAAHEAPNLDRSERLEFPTETWAAQDIRKAAVFEYAAGHASDPATRATFLERAAFFFDYSVMTLAAKPTHTLTRPIVLLLAYAFQRPTLDLSRVSGLTVSVDSGVPARFVPYKRRVIRNMAVVGGLAAALGMASAFAFLYPW